MIRQSDARRIIRAAKAEGFDRVEFIDPKTGLKVVCEKTDRAEDVQPAEALE